MNKSILVSLTTVMLAIFIIACDPDGNMVAPMQLENQSTATSQNLAKVNPGMIWADGILFATVGTPTNFKASAGPFDELYAGTSFLDKIGAISESKPGDQDYNGGRWHVNVLKEGVDPGKYASASSVGDLDLSDFQGTDTYFECPLLPRHM
jgi:hypothetical protein